MPLSDEDLSRMVREVLVSGFPDLQLWGVKAAFGYAGSRYAYVRCAFPHSRPTATITVNRRLRDLSHGAVKAIVAHELAHLALGWRGPRHSEEEVSREAMRRGFEGCFRELFRGLCRYYCKRYFYRPAFPYIAQGARYRSRLIVMGLKCEEFCPLYDPDGSS